MPQPKNNTAEEPAALTPGEHNPYLEGLLQQGAETEAAIKGWFERRDNLRTTARAAVKTGFCSEEQATRVEGLWPFPKRTKKAEGEGGGEGEKTS